MAQATPTQVSMPEFEQWQTSTPNWLKLGYINSHKNDLAIQLVFNSALSDDRKDWIKWHTEDVNQRREQNLPDDYL
ncbi:unnamed protein product [Rotaria magnacalcarata]|uniref:Uncharacterized protein n=1 Tax=Rotaria magnacalcarata TaxID=392030 RepID=A0A819ZEY1_9BILA|nr:unnamed protein product [Rotaria magnacalcarata]CAF4180910.1 unnamed protein product [Rotaria magnacalcarata]